MMDNATFDPETHVLTTAVQESYRKRFQLRQELVQVEHSLKQHEQNLRHYMANKGYKEIEMQGFRIRYAYPRPYYQLNRPRAELAIEYPELFHEKIGFESLRVSQSR